MKLLVQSFIHSAFIGWPLAKYNISNVLGFFFVVVAVVLFALIIVVVVPIHKIYRMPMKRTSFCVNPHY